VIRTELLQRLGRREVHLAHDGAQPRIDFFPAAALAEVTAHDVVQGQWLRQSVGDIHRQARGQLLRQPLIEQPWTGVRLDPQQLRADDRNDAAFLNVVQQVVPGVVIEILDFGKPGDHMQRLG
jgi:hypothetical protein